MSTGLSDANKWHRAPAEWEICNYDAPKVRYRNLVEDYLSRYSDQTLKKKSFVTIATNVLCANIPSSKEDVDPAECDLYLPLEISLTKWSAADSNKPDEKRTLNNRVWLINPGPPNGHGPGTVNYARDHRKQHKIDFQNIHPNDTYFRQDLVKVAKEINSLLTEDRIVFSSQLKNCRQDLGSLKWLNREIGFKLKPIRVFSLEDLYVVIIRRLLPDGEDKKNICQGLARLRFENEPNTYEAKSKCEYHKDIAKSDEDNDTGNCAKAITDLYSNVLLTDIEMFTYNPDPEENKSPVKEKCRQNLSNKGEGSQDPKGGDGTKILDKIENDEKPQGNNEPVGPGSSARDPNMVQKCWHYNVYNDTTTSTCRGPFEKCATLIECSTEGRSNPACFALAELVNQDATNNGTQKSIMLSAGCFENAGIPNCDTECRGAQRPQNDRYYCCCTSDGCNNNIIISKTIPASIPAKSNQSSTSTPVVRPNTNMNYTLPVILIVLMSFVTLLLMATYFRRRRLKRTNNSRGRSPDHGSLGSSDNVTMGNHRHELHDMRSNPETLTPFRNSFGNDEHSNFLNGQHETHQHDNHFTNYATRLDTNDDANRIASDNNVHQEKIDLKRVELLDVVGSGRFGTVHKANLLMTDEPASSLSAENTSPMIETTVPASGNDETQSRENNSEQRTSEIAVKIIPNNELQSWQNELAIYRSPRTRHPNILKFLGYTVSPSTSSHWLLVEYASNGSLHHYLKENIVSWPDLLSIALGIVRGLSHLHDGDIAHRDFKSKNVLLRHNLSPCITDFGVAAMLDIGSSGSHHEHRKKYLQVGTPRYMAPEVLDCAVAFTKISFTKIDVYALSLVLWELVSRCYPLPKSWDSDYDDTLDPNFSQGEKKATANHTNRVPITSAPPRSLQNHNQPDQSGKQFYQQDLSQTSPGVVVDGDNPSTSLLEQVRSSSPRNTSSGEDVTDGGVLANSSANGFEVSIDLSDIMAPTRQQPSCVPVYKMPFEDEVGPNPDINVMRQAVVSDKLRPPIHSEWRFYPVSKLAQAIVDGWEYDHDARISASCFVERIESLQQQQQQLFQTRNRRAAPNTNPSATQQANGDANSSWQQKHSEPPPVPPELSTTAIMT